MPSKSKVKGSTFERNIAKFLNETYKTDKFQRTPLSGAFVGRSNWNKSAMETDIKQALAADIIVPDWFPYSIEAKAYKDSPDFANIVKGKDGDLDKWIGKSCYDAINQQMIPMVTFKINNKGTFFVLPRYIVDADMIHLQHYFVYNSYFVIIEQQQFLNIADHLRDIPEETVKQFVALMQDTPLIKKYVKLHAP